MELKDKYLWGGWQNCLYISNGYIDLVVTTDIGPRIMRYGFVGQKNLFGEIEKDMGKNGGDEYRLYGGTRLWHAPEAIPRTYFPDNEPVEYELSGGAVRILQKVEANTRMQKEIIIKAAQKDSMTEVIYRIHNKSLWPVKYSVWAISIMVKNGRGIIPQEPYKSWDKSLSPERTITLWSYTKMEDSRWRWGNDFIQLSHNVKSASPQKFGLLNKSGWCAYYVDGIVFVKRFNFENNAKYPDHQCNNELYTDAGLLEIETLGPLKIVEPGSYLEHKENWYLFKTNLDDSEETIKKTLIPLLKQTKIPA